MPGSTPNRGYPFPLATEPPAGHDQIEALATAVDLDLTAEFATTDYVDQVAGAHVGAFGSFAGTTAASGSVVVCNLIVDYLSGITQAGNKLQIPTAGFYVATASMQHGATIGSGHRAFVEVINDGGFGARSSYGVGEDRQVSTAVQFFAAAALVSFQFMQQTGASATMIGGRWAIKYLGAAV